MIYQDLIISKIRALAPSGFTPDRPLSEGLFPHQKSIVRWAVRRGRAAIFADAGLGKSRTQIEWARHISIRTGKPVLVFAPLTVARQTVHEGNAIGVSSEVIAIPSQMQENKPGIYLTNYDKFDRFRECGKMLGGVVLDESSILKSIAGKIRNALIDGFQVVPYRICCTATPAPNDITEIANHAEFLGIKTRAEMLATWFVHDAEGWRLKRHATGEFYRWLASWAVYLRKPSDIGFTDEGYDLPPLDVRQVVVESNVPPEGFLFATSVSEGIVGRSKVRRASLTDRVEAVAKLIEDEPGESWIIWTGLNEESESLAKRLSAFGSRLVVVEGSTSEDDKSKRIESFASGEAKILISKPRVCGFGLNLQVAARQAFCGIGDSWEQYYQCLRRSWRFGQTRPVIAYIVTSEMEDSIVSNVLNKETEAQLMGDSIIANLKDLEADFEAKPEVTLTPGIINEVSGRSWRLIHGDCVEAIGSLVDSNSVDLSVYSPPFATLYTYSDNPRDMGNSVDHAQFFEQFRFCIDQVFRVTKPGRLTCVHVAQIAASLGHDGYIGLHDFRGAVISAYIKAGWIHHREVCIDKCPQAQAIRTKSKALLFVQKDKDRSWIGPAIADYILVFRKPGENVRPINSKDIDNETWIQWARPIWYGIRETKTLNVAEGRGEKDERHICPLQLEVIERCVKLWSNPGETVLSPFAGIGSEGYQSLLNGRQFIGTELKPEYFKAAVRNLKRAEKASGETDLFDEAV